MKETKTTDDKWWTDSAGWNSLKHCPSTLFFQNQLARFFHFWVWGWNPVMCGSSLSIPPQHELLFCCTILFKKLKVNVFFLYWLLLFLLTSGRPKGLNYLLGIHACIIDWSDSQNLFCQDCLNLTPFKTTVTSVTVKDLNSHPQI